MSIFSDFRELVETIFDDLEELLDGTCLGSPDEERDRQAPNPGDIIGVDRGIYQHYGIYAGEGRVIHYTADTSDLDPENAEIQETSLEHFLRDDTECFILEVEEEEEVSGNMLNMILSVATSGQTEKAKTRGRKEAGFQHIFSSEETLQRARSRIGEHNYNLITNNCEHFVVWCKTGLSDSRQVRQWAALCSRILINAGLVLEGDA